MKKFAEPPNPWVSDCCDEPGHEVAQLAEHHKIVRSLAFLSCLLWLHAIGKYGKMERQGDGTNMNLTPNEVLQKHSDSRSKLTVRTFSDNETPEERYVLLEGDETALKFLADLILAHLTSGTCNISLHPKAAGKVHFDPESTMGIYIHRLPCDVHANNVVR